MNYNLRVLIILILLTPKVFSAADESTSSSGDEFYNKREIEKTIHEIDQYQLSDSLWKMWEDVVNSQFIVPAKDSSDALKKLAEGTQKVKRAVEMIEATSQDSIDSWEKDRIKITAILELEKARVDLEESIRLNPYDHRTQKWLIWIFQRLADLHAERESYDRSTTLLEYLAYILKDDPQLYYKLGENYLWLKNWQKAWENLQKSINLILETDWETINTDELFSHYSLRAEAEIKLGLVSEALLTLNYAKLIVSTPEEEQQIQWKIDWINWDGGNLEHSLKYDQLKMKLNNCADYQALKFEFLELLEQLTMTTAKNEIHWQIAKIEFQHLNQKAQAIDRLFQIVKTVKTDSLRMATEFSDQKYLSDYGMMCYNLGMEYLKDDNFKLAYTYFIQSVAVYWEGIGKSYLQLASLSTMNNDIAIKFCMKALLYRNSLTAREIHNTYQILANSHKRKGEFEQAEQWYRNLADIQL